MSDSFDLLQKLGYQFCFYKGFYLSIFIFLRILFLREGHFLLRSDSHLICAKDGLLPPTGWVYRFVPPQWTLEKLFQRFVSVLVGAFVHLCTVLIFKRRLIFILCVQMFYLHIMCITGCLRPEEARRVIRSPGTGVTDHCGYWKPNLGLFQEQKTLLISESFLQPHYLEKKKKINKTKLFIYLHVSVCAYKGQKVSDSHGAEVKWL